MRAASIRTFLLVGVISTALFAFGCGSNSGGSQSQNNGNGNGGSTSNVQTITVNGGPTSSYVDGAFTSVTVCVHGTSTCQTIDGVLVDTGSFGLRILSSALTINLPQQMDSSGNPIAECAAFGGNTVTWGPVQTADVKIAGEQANSMPIQVIGSPNFSTVPSGCNGQPMDDLTDLGANGLLGIGQAIPDEQLYFSCPASGCVATTESAANQVQNPVASFATDNNGVIVELPSVTSVEGSVNGSLIFGIGTQSNNSLGSQTVFGTDSFGNFSTTYKSAQYLSFLDSGSNGIYFLDQAATGIAPCTTVDGQDISFWYCPSPAQNISVVNNAQAGTNGASQAATFTAGNAALLITEGNNAAINGLTGPMSNIFDFGLPFFFGLHVYVAIDGRSTPGGTGPYTAY